MIAVQPELSALKQLSDQIRGLEYRMEERLKAQHGRFNLFTTLLAAHDEVRLHTRFLHELLNPDGSHDCGDLFLKLFFKTLNEHKALEHDGMPSQVDWEQDQEPCRWAGKEVSTEHGQLDLLLEFESRQLIIENKIWAGEQDRQVARYIEYLDGQQGHVLYLTLDGKAASTHEGKPYLRISYREHIAAWIESCLQSTYSIIPINQTLIQYQRVINQLTGKTANSESINMIKEYLRNHPAIIESRESVNQGIRALRVDMRNEFADALIAELAKDFIVNPRPDMLNNNFGEDSFGDLIIRPREHDFTAPHHDAFEIWIEQIDAHWHGLVIGIESGWNKKRPLTEEEVMLLNKIRDKFVSHYAENGVGHATDKVTWGGTNWPCSWHGLIYPFMESDASFAKMLDHSHFEQLVQHAASEVRNYMKLLEKYFTECR
jgi:hypothetical protein